MRQIPSPMVLVQGRLFITGKIGFFPGAIVFVLAADFAACRLLDAFGGLLYSLEPYLIDKACCKGVLERRRVVDEVQAK